MEDINKIIDSVDSPIALVALVIIVFALLFKGVIQLNPVSGVNSYKLVNKVINVLALLSVVGLLIFAFNNFQSSSRVQAEEAIIYPEESIDETESVEQEEIKESQKMLPKEKKETFSDETFLSYNVLLSYSSEMIGGNILLDNKKVGIADNRTKKISMKALGKEQILVLEKGDKRCTTSVYITKENQQIPFLNCP